MSRSLLVQIVAHEDPVSLRLFVAVCETNSIAKAAEREAISPSALSKRISDLEKSFDTVLLDRWQRGVTPTAAGEALLAHARHLLQSLDRMHSEVSEYGEGVRGHVRLLAIPTAIAEFLPEQLAAFLKANAHISVSLEEKVTASVLRGVENGAADIGICRDLIATPDLEVRPLGSDQRVVVVSAHHPLAREQAVTLEQTLDFEHVELSQHASLLTVFNRAAGDLSRELRVRLNVPSFDAALRVIDSGVAIGIMPIEVVGRFKRLYNLQVIPLSEEWATQKFVICTRRGPSSSPAARRLLDYLLLRAL
jgi:DNA-binding transcriptional LysR family regulator